MKLARIDEVEQPGPRGILAKPFIEGELSNVRIIRLAPGATLPPHRHGTSDLMLYVVEGQGELDTSHGLEPFGAGTLACYQGDEELRVRNVGPEGLTMLAFLAPKFATS